MKTFLTLVEIIEVKKSFLCMELKDYYFEEKKLNQNHSNKIILNQNRAHLWYYTEGGMNRHGAAQ